MNGKKAKAIRKLAREIAPLPTVDLVQKEANRRNLSRLFFNPHPGTQKHGERTERAVYQQLKNLRKEGLRK